MWILPKQLHTSAFVPDTEALISDLDELSQVCEQSLLARSKPSRAQTWLRRWKRDSWMQHLYGRILKPSRGTTFVTAWTSSLEAIPASPSAQQESEPEQTTRDTSGHISQMELFECDRESASLKTSKDTLPLGCVTCCKTWQEWVTERRGAYSQRVKSAHRINASGCSFWPTVRNNDSKNSTHSGAGYRYLCGKVLDEQKNWPIVRASEYKDVGPVGSKGHKHMLGKHYLCAVVTQDAAMSGHPAQANHSTDASRRESWLTPRASEPESDPNFAARNADRGLHCHGTLTSQAKAWATPIQGDSHLASTPEVAKKRMEEGKVTLSRQMAAQVWATPRTPTGGPETAKRKQELGRTAKGGGDLASQANGKLNPRWVETLMGLPIGWTMPSCANPVTIAPTNCVCLETGSSRQPQKKRSEP